jgi:hypothetical protein
MARSFLSLCFFPLLTFKYGIEWMIYWLSNHSSWCNTRDFEVSTNQWGLDQSFSLVPGEEVEDFTDNKHTLTYLPSVSTTSNLWYKGHWMTVHREQTQGRWGANNVLHIGSDRLVLVACICI